MTGTTINRQPPTPLEGLCYLELIPAIDRDFRTIPNRDSRAIGGISVRRKLGGTPEFAASNLFGAVGLHSTPIFSTDTNQRNHPMVRGDTCQMLPRFYIDSGQNDRWLAYTLIFEEVLNNASIPHEWHLYPGFHEDPYWEAHLSSIYVGMFFPGTWRGNKLAMYHHPQFSCL